jgi:hypothetical protein
MEIETQEKKYERFINRIRKLFDYSDIQRKWEKDIKKGLRTKKLKRIF